MFRCCVLLAIVGFSCAKEQQAPQENPTQSANTTAIKHTAKIENGAKVVIPAESLQLVAVVSKDWSSRVAKTVLYSRDSSQSPWKQESKGQKTMLGHAGLGWGVGLHEIDGSAGPQKNEGDGRTPAGIFAIGPAFGYDKKKTALGWPYSVVDAGWGCVDDATRSDYNTITADHAKSDPTFQSAERMRRADELYRWVVEVHHNGGKQRSIVGRGSCIFFHVWLDENSPSIGCAAVPADVMESLIDWLEPAKHPVAVFLPAAVYRERAEAWMLPRLVSN